MNSNSENRAAEPKQVFRPVALLIVGPELITRAKPFNLIPIDIKRLQTAQDIRKKCTNKPVLRRRKTGFKISMLDQKRSQRFQAHFCKWKPLIF